MSRRRAIALLAAAAGIAAWLRRRRESRRERVTIGYEDGSAITLEDGSAEAERLLAIARPALRP